jgi:hypothetical protein
VSIAKAEIAASPAAAAYCSKTVNKLQMNSNCQLDFTFANGEVGVIACLIGPSESKFASKQDFSKAFIEVNLRMPN